ncbi:hypothetical protein CBR_g8384 [Chara braunii]|uniref:S1 motif domain-containing protein n=1 Tax=Chara braunii TaxID=69332 RepID=A0A388KLZ6_CHABU|nr:hypothetical protein CBR_g8384 [Chara braunii]|eukprot:GBG71084.1 hypothetical protein CBR_g8384 [Chara braunii]
MLHSNVFFKKTRKNTVRRVVREHYLRDDIACGALSCRTCENNTKACLREKILVVDTNVVLNQIDLLENPAITDVVILSVVMEEVQHKNLSVYNRLRALVTDETRHFFVFLNEHHRETYITINSGESPNDRNDRAIRVATQWYQRHLGRTANVVLITNDVDNLKKATADGIPGHTVNMYVKSLGKPELFDLISGFDMAPMDEAHAADERPTKKKAFYPEHKLMSEITSGLQKGIYHQGKLRVNLYNPFEAYVGTETLPDEVLIHGRIDMNRAVDGDVVAIELLPEDQYCGSLEAKVAAAAGTSARALFVSVDRRIPKIRIHTRQLSNLMGKRIIVAVDSWENTSRFPNGHYVRTIGDIGDRATESEMLLIENDIDSRPFSEQVLACLPPLPWSMPEEEFHNPNRLDLRHVRIYSVDPPGCRDIDDALHCTARPDGNYEVGVHIADVTNYVLPGTALDEEATKRGTSVYLVERRIDMLPKPLTEDICSLRGNVERLAFSVIWEMTPNAEIISTKYTKAIIKSCAAMSYAEAQAKMDDSRMNDPLTTDLRNMNRLAKIQILVARKPVLFGIDLDISSSKTLADSLDNAIKEDDPLFNKLVRILTTRCMTQALYFSSGDLAPSEYHHYGLASPIYTHFTSPIRRYADVIVHRLLAAALGLSAVPGNYREKGCLTSIADGLNYRHRNAQMAGRASVELHTVIFFKNRPTDADACIVKVRANGFIAFVPKYGIEGPIYLVGKDAPPSAQGKEYILDEVNQCITSNDGQRTYKVLEHVSVHIEVVEPRANQPKLQLSLRE